MLRPGGTHAPPGVLAWAPSSPQHARATRAALPPPCLAVDGRAEFPTDQLRPLAGSNPSAPERKPVGRKEGVREGTGDRRVHSYG